ncbi:MAG: hypothetical protein HC895_02965 [Leptolyngbyaceae cyanobacterium SM1_3_5]|nr:hypothetical protein [Leptolyngbyaceae cyanobacterium SM1_3_5]
MSEAKQRDGDRLSLRDCAERGCGRVAADATAQALQSPLCRQTRWVAPT